MAFYICSISTSDTQEPNYSNDMIYLVSLPQIQWL